MLSLSNFYMNENGSNLVKNNWVINPLHKVKQTHLDFLKIVIKNRTNYIKSPSINVHFQVTPIN